MSTIAPTRSASTQFKPVHDKAALREAFIAHAAEGRTNAEFAEIHGVSLRTLMLYKAEWRQGAQAASVADPEQPHDIEGEQEFSPIASADKERALKVYRRAMEGKPITPTRLAAAREVLKLTDTVTDERSEFQKWPDAQLTKLLVELAPRCGIGEARIMPDIKHTIPAPLHIDASPAAQALAPSTETTAASIATSSPEGGQPEQGNATDSAPTQHAQESPPQISSSFQEPTADEGHAEGAEHAGRRADETGAD